MPLGTEYKKPMANTYTQIHIQAVFAVSNRESLIQEEWEADLYKYITGIIQNHGHKVLQINGVPDHVHLFFGMRPTQSLSDLMKQVKGDSSKFINEKAYLKHKFSWQAGYEAFSYTKADVPKIIQYIKNQKEHHRTKSFADEYIDLLKSFDIEYDERYTFKKLL